MERIQVPDCWTLLVQCVQSSCSLPTIRERARCLWYRCRLCLEELIWKSKAASVLVIPDSQAVTSCQMTGLVHQASTSPHMLFSCLSTSIRATWHYKASYLLHCLFCTFRRLQACPGVPFSSLRWPWRGLFDESRTGTATQTHGGCLACVIAPEWTWPMTGSCLHAPHQRHDKHGHLQCVARARSVNIATCL
jgi:hypothetical protein